MDFIGYLCDSIAQLREFAIDPRRRSAEGRTSEVDHHCGHSAIQGLLGPSTIITRYELRVGPGIYVRSAGFWIIWKETDPGITAILWYRDSSSSDLRSLFFFLPLFSFILAGRPPLLSFHPPRPRLSLGGLENRGVNREWARFGEKFTMRIKKKTCYNLLFSFAWKRKYQERIADNVSIKVCRGKKLKPMYRHLICRGNSAIW